MSNIVVCGAAGFIGTHLVNRLKADGHTVYGIDRKQPEFTKFAGDHLLIWDLRHPKFDFPWDQNIDEVYQLAAEMGGAGYLFTGQNDVHVLQASAQINLNVLDVCAQMQPPKIFFASSACVYPDISTNLSDPDFKFFRACCEQDAYPANPDSEYGWEKLFSERLYSAAARNLNMDIRIGRFHNVFGPYGTYKGGREKFPAALCRKVAEASHGGAIELWGDGTQTRSFMYVNDAIEGMIRLMASDFTGPVNIGSSRMVTIEEVAKQVIAMSGKWLDIKYVDGPVGVMGRNSDNTLIKEKLGWEPRLPLESGLLETYQWIAARVARDRGKVTIDGLPASV